MVERKQVEADLSANIVEYFREQNMTLREIADKIGVSESFISRVARKERCFTIEHLLAFEKATEQPLPLLLLNAISQESVSEELADLYQATRELLSSSLKLQASFDKRKNVCGESNDQQRCHSLSENQSAQRKEIATKSCSVKSFPIKEIKDHKHKRSEHILEVALASVVNEKAGNEMTEKDIAITHSNIVTEIGKMALSTLEEKESGVTHARLLKKERKEGGLAIASKVFEEYGDFIAAVINCKVSNESKADELFNDLFLSLVSKPLPLNRQNIKGRLYRAIINDIADSTRRVERFRALTNKYTKQLDYYKTKDNPENVLVEAEERDKIFKLIQKRLRRTEAEAILLRYKGNLKTKEVAEKMGVSQRSVKRYINSGLKRIRRFLKED